MFQRIRKALCRHKEQYPARIGRDAVWQCAKCDKFTGVIEYDFLGRRI